MARPTTRFASRTMRDLERRMLARRDEILANARTLRTELVEAMRERDRSDMLDQDSPTVDVSLHSVYSVLDADERRLYDIEAALERVERGTYGFCQCCGDPIPLERLKALPETRWCVGCSRDPSCGRAHDGNMHLAASA